MKNILHDGIPLDSEYAELIKSEDFKGIERFSESFLLNNVKPFKFYDYKWVKDPLHQWSRQWEYPYVYNKIKQVAEKDPELNVLDAGSGVTFFPYYLSNELSDSNIHCCDYDDLEKAFDDMNSQLNQRVKFSNADLRSLPYENESFHVIYCISVLEHTNEYERIIDEFYRLLRPGGTLVITFDISLDGTRDIAVDEGEELLKSLVKRFPGYDSPQSLSADALRSDIFTTLKVGNMNRDLLPWRLPSFLYQLKTFVSTRCFVSWPPPLTVFCLSLVKPSE